MATLFRTGSLWLKIASIAVILGLLLFVIGFATNAWVVNRGSVDQGAGLWNRYGCNRRGCSTDKIIYLNDYHRAIQAMECLGLIGFFLATLVLLLYMIMDSCRRRDFLQAATGFTFIGLFFACVGFALYGSSSNRDNLYGLGRDIGWSMGVACAGAAFYGIAGIMLIIQLIR